MNLEIAAEAAMRAMIDALRAKNWKAVCAVCDDHGEVIALFRRDGAPLTSVTIASNKAYTAARERKASRRVGQASRDAQNGFDLAYFGDPRYTGWGGGFPLVHDEVVVGAVAVSGLSQDDDEEIAMIGKEAFERTLSV